jgi:hypothetical protein
MEPTGKASGTFMFFGGIRRSIPSYAQGFGGLSSSHSSTAIDRGLLRRWITVWDSIYHHWEEFGMECEEKE